VDITMPQLGETVTEGTITRWLKRVGEQVETDEPLFEVSTDKVDSEVPAPAAGLLTEIRVPEGETAAVGAVLAVIGDAAASPPPAAPVEPATRPEPAIAPSVAEPPTTAAPRAAAPPVPAPPPAPQPPAAPPPAAATTAQTPAVGEAAAAVTSPVVRRLLAEHNLDPAQILGTGQGGRMTRKDVLDAAAKGQNGPPEPSTAPAPPPAAVPPAPEPPAPPPLAPVLPPPAVAAPAAPVVDVPAPPPPAAPAPSVVIPPAAPTPPTTPAASFGAKEQTAETARGDEVLAFSNIRRSTAEHMVRSKATSPHVYTSVEVDYEHVATAREHHREAWRAREGFPLTYLPFVARAVGYAIGDFPYVNASVVGDSLVVHRDVHLAIAVDLDFDGLVAPVIRDADGKRLRLLAREIRSLAERARTKQLSPDEVLGGTFTITNPGPFGTYMTLPIINQPQVAVLSTDSVRKRPAVVAGPDGSDSIAVRHIGILALAWDHRAFDGAYAAAFLAALKKDIETRDWEAEIL
jgi:pyruvate dehydrogenase E2 component (dihydrolipoamide acetyltransferase)